MILKIDLRFVAGIIAICVAAVLLIVFLQGRLIGARKLTTAETKIQRFVHEVYGQKIVAEQITFQDDDAVLAVSLRDAEVASLNINLSSLARKQKTEGLSDAVIKLGWCQVSDHFSPAAEKANNMNRTVGKMI
jgi:hypothetical protein